MAARSTAEGPSSTRRPLKVVNSAFPGNNCYASGPDLGGGTIRAVGMCLASPIYITNDTFSGNGCSNGGALSSWRYMIAAAENVGTGFVPAPGVRGTADPEVIHLR